MGHNVKQVMVDLRPSIDAALAEVAKKHGLSKLHLSNGTYSNDGCFTFKVEGVVEGGLDKDAARYKQSTFLGLPPLGTEMVIGGKTYRTSGVNTTGTKVLMARVPDGKRFLYPTDIIKRLASTVGVAS